MLADLGLCSFGLMVKMGIHDLQLVALLIYKECGLFLTYTNKNICLYLMYFKFHLFYILRLTYILNKYAINFFSCYGHIF